MSETQEQGLAAALYEEIEAREKAERELADLRRDFDARTADLVQVGQERDEARAADLEHAMKLAEALGQVERVKALVKNRDFTDDELEAALNADV